MSLVHESPHIKSFVAGVGPAYLDRFSAVGAVVWRLQFNLDSGAPHDAPWRLPRSAQYQKRQDVGPFVPYDRFVVHYTYCRHRAEPGDRDGSFPAGRDVRRRWTSSDSCRNKTATAPPRDKAIISISISLNESD